MKIKIAKMHRQMVAIGLSVAACIGFCMLSVGLVFSADAAASTSPAVTLKTNIQQTACNISFLDGSGAPIASTFNLGSISSSGINQIYPTGVPFQIKLSGCGIAGTTYPLVTLTGVNAVKGDGTNGKNQFAFKFRDSGPSGGTSKEYFVVVGKELPMKYVGISQAGGLYSTAAGTQNTIIKGNAGDSGDSLTKTLYATVACDDLCTYGKGARAGSVNASLTFQFEYK